LHEFRGAYLMLAEAQGMQNPAVGGQTLTNFVAAYRQPGYTCNAQTKEIFLEELWKQRRIELWGEGFSYFDIMRFQKGIDRRGGGYDPTLVYVVSPDDPVLLYEINIREAQANTAIGPTSNGASVPNAVAE
ncbi:MAG: RagB/SusD family nutrient uptake outer membrane protein, partial [Muribaculaceae bacterium]|nr:RagB/SusD family nutrient uptake outer membrane protein [Muribaculaceae bacterium]